jgi:hypothetical protein
MEQTKEADILGLKSISNKEFEEMKPDIDKILDVYFYYGIAPCINGIDPKIIDYIEKKIKRAEGK